MAESKHKKDAQPQKSGSRAGLQETDLRKGRQKSELQTSRQKSELQTSRQESDLRANVQGSILRANVQESDSQADTKESRLKQVLLLVVLLILVIGGSLLFVGAAGGWFNGFEKATLSAECLTERPEFIDLTPTGYEELVKERKTFVVFVDQVGCKTAVNLQSFLENYMQAKGFSSYRLMFSDLKETSLYDFVKYYPSVVIIDEGEVKTFLKADSDADAEKYNSEEALVEWLDENLEFKN